MTKKLTFLLLVFLTNTLVTLAQNKTTTDKKTESPLQDIEKIYLHTDKSYYTTGEILWYKAYLVYAYTNVLFDNSNLLYVELISPDSKIIARNITRIDNGLGHGNIMLTDSTGVKKTGTYQLRAYTNWMRNFGDDFVFTKDIEIIAHNETIINEPKKNNALSSNLNDKISNTISIDKDENLISIQFFPEGGSLIENVPSIVAFKATDKNGNPYEIEGYLYDSNRNAIVSLKSSHDGMGKFMITPENNQQYSSEITDPSGKKISTIIPKAEKTGYVMTVANLKGKNTITIKTNQATLNQKKDAPLKLIGSTRGITYYEGTQSLNTTEVVFSLPEDDFPEGIAQITLFDGDTKPQSERLLYIEKDHAIDATLSSDKKQYAPREKVNLTISAKTKINEPLFASFSIASVDANLIDKETDNEMNICSYFLMASDIKGKVHNPGYYFDSSKSERLPHLDLLLMTQGWRDFLWKKLPALKDSTTFKLEKGIKISGKVKNLFSSTLKKNTLVNMILAKNGKSVVMKDTTDLNGKFEFDNIVFMGDATILLNTQNENGKNKGMFLLDSIYSPPIAVNYKSKIHLSEDQNKIKKFEENSYKHNILYDIPKENFLNEVVIKTEKVIKKAPRASKYGFADRSYIIDENSPKFPSIYQLIQFSIPNISLIQGSDSLRFTRYNTAALIVLDGVEVTSADLQFINPEDVTEIGAHFTPGTTGFLGGANGIILVYTKVGAVHRKKIKIFHTITKKIDGFQYAKKFYSPDYKDQKSVTTEKKDVRNTLYWNPYIHLDENGTNEISYYNSDVSTEVKVTLEGITNNGIPIVLKTNYSIQKQSN
jgi:hypothetical protein